MIQILESHRLPDVHSVLHAQYKIRPQLSVDEYEAGPIVTRLGGIAVLLVGNLVWRMMCEGAILLFSLHELLVSIDTRAGVLVRQGKRAEP